MLAEEGRFFVKQAVRTGQRIEGTQQRSCAAVSRDRCAKPAP